MTDQVLRDITVRRSYISNSSLVQTDTMNPMLDEENAFSSIDFQVIADACPLRGWRDAVVFQRSMEQDVLNKEVRHSEVVKETNMDTVKTCKQILLRKLLPWLKRQAGFRYCYLRPRHTEWLRYRPKMFFRKHTDFERYKCNGMVPYVALVGLIDTVEGGQTRVGERDLIGAARRNGLVFFPSNIVHESRVVLHGYKVCLKMEFFVFMADKFLEVSDEENAWRSFWSQEEMALVDNYISAHADFVKKDKIVTSTDTARLIHNMMLHIADPRQHHHDSASQEMLFPDASASFLHDLFVAYRFIKEPTADIVLLRDARAWEYVNTMMDLPAGYTLCCALWYREDEELLYTYHSACDRVGDPLHWWMMGDDRRGDGGQFCEFDLIRVKMIKDFLEEHEFGGGGGGRFSGVDMVKKPARGPCVSTPTERVLRSVSPSDDVHRAVRKAGMITETEKEFCNDADSGYMTYTSKRYATFYIQVRWCISRSMNPRR